MSRYFLAFIFFFGIGTETSSAQDNVIVKKDLRSDWLVFEQNQYVPFGKAEQVGKTIYFLVNQKNFRSDYLSIKARSEFSVFLNGNLLVDQSTEAIFSLDSLQRLFPGSSYFFSVHSSGENLQMLRTLLQSKVIVSNALAEESQTLRRTSFRDFVVVAMLVLLIFLVGVIRLNPRLSSDYFSVTKLFSLRELDSDQFYYRITSGNILFYLLISLALSFLILVIGQFVSIGINDLLSAEFFTTFLTWLKLTASIFIFLFLKMFLVQMVASLFGIRDVAGFHFFNFTRLLLVTAGILTLVLSSYNLLRGQRFEVYNAVLDVLTWITGGWVVLLFLKLTNRVTYAVFHLFSYICATEIIPFLLIMKVMN